MRPILKRFELPLRSTYTVVIRVATIIVAYPGFELGVVPPFGGPAGDRVVIDRALSDTEHLIVEAGVHDTSLRLRTHDLLALTSAQVADIVA